MKRIKEKYDIYLSGSIISGKQIENFCLKFPKNNFNIFLPHQIEGTKLAHANLPKTIFDICLKEMDKADLCLLNLDSYGRDSSWECGWFNAKNKPVIGYVSANLSFLQDWMIKGGLQGVLVDNSVLYDVIINDPILKYIKQNIRIFEETPLNKYIEGIINNI